jgi:hypothetical protein
LNIIAVNDDIQHKNRPIMTKIYEELADKAIEKSIFVKDEISEHLRKTGKQISSGRTVEAWMFWEKIFITEIERNFMGDLFTTSVHSDRVLFELTRQTIADIEKNVKVYFHDPTIKIEFHISKLLDKI